MKNMMGQLLPYLPKIFGLLSTAPAFLAGYGIAFFVFLFVIGPTAFRQEIAPIAGFHVVSLVLFKVLWKYYGEGQAAAAAVKVRQESVKSFSKDIKLMSHGPKLD